MTRDYILESRFRLYSFLTMSKRKLNKQQQTRVKSMQDKRQERASSAISLDDADLGPEQEGLLLAHFGKTLEVESDTGEIFHCQVRQNLPAMVCGDKVTWRAGKNQSGVVNALLPRESFFARPDDKNQLKPIAANVNQIIIVTAPEPPFIQLLLDSYLVACETLHISPLIVFNKYDLLAGNKFNDFAKLNSQYEKIGYPVANTSVDESRGLDDLQTQLKNKTSVLVGQSGVGKSSLIKKLLPEIKIAIAKDNELSIQRYGTHTTSTTRFYHLPTGGALIDSPGIREFGLWHLQSSEIANGFIEFRNYISDCKFRNCQHTHEPDCAVLKAVSDGLIYTSRLESYHLLLENT